MFALQELPQFIRMISYHTKDWFRNIFRFHKADTFRKLFPLILLLSLYTWAVDYFELSVMQLGENGHLKNLSLMHNLLGFALSILLVFRTNTAYDRWWEGRRLWGSLVNSSRNLAIKLSAFLSGAEESHLAFFRHTIPAFATALKEHLSHESTRTALFDDLSTALTAVIDQEKHIPNQIASLLVKRVTELYKNGALTGDQLFLVNNELQSFSDICGGCERIKNTPIPFSYSVFIKKFIFIYIITLPFGLVFSLGYVAIPVVAFVFYILASLELIAEEIEDPFGGDPNDVPMAKIAGNIHKHIAELI